MTDDENDEHAGTPEPTRKPSKRVRDASSKKRARDDVLALNLELMKESAKKARHIVVFSGSGLSATSGMSTFSTKGGLYERAKARYKLSSGKVLFTYPFYSKRKKEAEAFFVDIHREALLARPSKGHEALAELREAGKLARHYTLNIDGLASRVGEMDVWDPDVNPSGCVVEMHGSVHELVCATCGETRQLTSEDVALLSSETSVPCTSESCREERVNYMRFKVMMYDDSEGECITPDDVMDLMEEDIKQADVVIWVGISFEQSASTSYFRNVRRWLQEEDRHRDVPQFVVNPSDDAMWNVLTASSNLGELNVYEVRGTAEETLPELLQAEKEILTELN
jgi:NAD-dependent SIR2 family protein deacetylase